MLKLGKEVDYAVYILLGLKESSEMNTISLREFAQKEQLPYLYIQRIAQKLKQAGIISAIQGSKGGYFLSSDKKTITVKDVFFALDRIDGTVPCIADDRACPRAQTCKTKHLMHHINRKMFDAIGNISIFDYVHETSS